MTRAWLAMGRPISLDRPLLMGILNVTPDSFSDGGLYSDLDAAIAHGLSLVESGADIVDVGGESTRPGAEEVAVDVEVARTIPVVAALAAEGVTVSIDTMKPAVAEAAISAGAVIVNDVGGLRDEAMSRVVAEAGCGVVIMHMKGTPRTMQANPAYADVVAEVSEHLEAKARAAVEAGIPAGSIVVDPGIGFGKTLAHNLELLGSLDKLKTIGYPLLIGTSRKSFLGELTGIEDPAARDLATAVTVALAVERGADVVRVHDPAAAREALAVARAIVTGGP